jgi:hypothetical protein
LLSASPNVVVSDLIQVSFFILTLDWLAFAVDDSILSNDSVLRRIHLDDLELYLSHASTDCEKVALSDRSVGFAEIWGEENIEEGAGKPFDGIGDREDSNTLGLSGY